MFFLATKNFITMVGLLLAMACTGSAPSRAATRPLVLVNTPPYEAFVKMIAGDTVDVICLAPPGSDPHVFETPPQHVERVMRSALWLRLGEPAEERYLTLFRQRRSNLQVIDLSVGLPLLKTADGVDRHFWLSPSLAREQMHIIAVALAQLVPDHAILYKERLARSMVQLEQIDHEVRTLMAAAPRALLISHPALGYFCREYDLLQLAIEHEGKDPLPADLEKLLTTSRLQGVRRVLLVPGHCPQGAERIAALLEVPTIAIDPYNADYSDMMHRIACAVGVL